ncbi:pimeloyl-ACP methyl ester carboxylesterase [Afipia massiliensis]|uniref:Pimeloyl-ACP methyl ester carboxylesterase n=1 Tax=Afipia massiliensis TaxID=211460 RepID=A0A840MT06_9BRAD|nr:alpha/beta hydrolase [Afipia massiliensis]MBB5051539.1 pimeloyl-ACP methyl ester carboxylesterase [Afipia massiliensis]
MPQSFRDVYCQSADGLKLHAKVIGPDNGTALPVLCLPGLTRTTDDFDDIARAIATNPAAPRKVVAVDYRGRGLSDYDPDPAKYTVPVELGDVLTIAASLGISRAILLGTSRGGLISMALAAAQPQLLAGVILNDIGPALEIDGLMKIKGYIANPPPRQTWDEAAGGLKELFGSVFPSLSDAEWMAWARRAFREKAGGGLERTYDLKLAHTLDGLDPANPLPQVWELFDKLAGVPVMLIHGGLSDLLSLQGVQDMIARRPDIELVTVADQGHAPLLADNPTMDRIVAFCARCDGATAS